MSPVDAGGGGGPFDDPKNRFSDGVAAADNVEVKRENDLGDFGNRDRSELAAVKEEGSDTATKEAGQASPGHHSQSRSADNGVDKKSGEQAGSGVQRVGNNNGGMMDIPELPEIPELKFNEGGDGHRGAASGDVQRRQQERQQERPGEGAEEHFLRHGGPAASGGLGPLPPASSPSSSLPSGMSRQEQEMSQHMNAGESNTATAFASSAQKEVWKQIFLSRNGNKLRAGQRVLGCDHTSPLGSNVRPTNRPPTN